MRAGVTSVPKRVLIYEPSAGGHHFKYVQLLVQAFSEKGLQIVLASTSESYERPEYTILLSQYEHLFTRVIVDHTERRSIYLNSLFHSWNILKLADRYDCNLVFIPYLDIYFYTLGILLRLRPSAKRKLFEGIIFRGDCCYEGHAKGGRNRVRRFAMETILASQVFHRALFLDELMYDSFCRTVPKAKAQMLLCPDPIETDYTITRDDFRTRFGIPREAKVLGVIGLIDSRKGVDRLLRAYEASSPAPNSYLLLMGKHSETVRESIRTNVSAAHIISLDRFVTDDEMISGINAVDVVAAVYPRHVGSASIVIRAAAAGKPVLGSDFGWIGHTIRKYGLGKVCDVLNEQALLEGVQWTFNNASCDRERARVFAGLNSVARFAEVVSRGFSE